MNPSQPVELDIAKVAMEAGMMEAIRTYFLVSEPHLMRQELAYVVHTTFTGEYAGEWVYASDSTLFTLMELHSMLPGSNQFVYIEKGRETGHSLMSLLIRSAVFERKIQKWWLYRLSMWINRVLQKIIDFRFASNRIAWYYWIERHSSSERIDP